MLNKFVFIYSIIFFTVFIFGISVGYFLIAPFFIHFLYRNSLYLGAQATYSIYPFVSFILIICITFGFLFEFPIILFLMTKLNLVQLNTLKHFRRHLYVLFFIISGIITPPDVFTQLIVAIPMIIFYELSLLFIKIYQSMSI